MMSVVIWVLFLHWIADFVCQTRWMAENKSKAYLPLTVHCLIYTLVLSIGLAPVTPTIGLLPFLAINFGLHFTIDAVTSRFTSWFWERKWIHLFFTMIGFDQFLHASSLLLTAHYLLRGV